MAALHLATSGEGVAERGDDLGFLSAAEIENVLEGDADVGNELVDVALALAGVLFAQA